MLCVALLQFSTAARQIVGRIRKRDLHICVDHMVETQIFIDVGSRNLACTDGLNDGRWAGYAVTAGIRALYIINHAASACLNIPAENRDAVFLEELNIRGLSNGRNNDITPQFLFLTGCIHRFRTSGPVCLSCNLRFHPECLYFALFICFNP